MRFFIYCLLVLLSACQSNPKTQTVETSPSLQKKYQAALYNVQLGIAYLKNGDLPRAKRKLVAALDLAPEVAEVNAAMAYYFETTKDRDRAKDFYRKALTLAPNSGAQLNNYGTFLCRLGHYSKAESYFLKAVNDVHYINTAVAYENAGLCALAQSDARKAEHYFSKALEQDPQRKQSLYEIVSLKLKRKETSKVLRILKRYDNLILQDKVLLALAIQAAHQAGKMNLELDYKRQLSQLNRVRDYITGANNDNNSSNG